MLGSVAQATCLVQLHMLGLVRQATCLVQLHRLDAWFICTGYMLGFNRTGYRLGLFAQAIYLLSCTR